MKHILIFDSPNFEKVHLHDNVPFASKYIIVPDEGDPEFKKHRYGKLGKFSKSKMFEAIDEQDFYPNLTRDDDLRKNIETAINSVSAENGSDTPDFILAEYLMDCLRAYDSAVQKREKWYGRPIANRSDPQAVKAEPDDTMMMVQVNGKNRGSIFVPPDSEADFIENKVMGHDGYTKHLLGKEVKKIVIVPNKLVNIIS